MLLVQWTLTTWHCDGAEATAQSIRSWVAQAANWDEGRRGDGLTDLTIPARGLPMVWSRTYNSRSAHAGALGLG